MLKLLSVYGRSEQINNILGVMGTRFLTGREKSYRNGKGKARIYPMVLEWKWRCQCELMGLNIADHSV